MRSTQAPEGRRSARLQHQEGIVTVTGEVGTGRTMLVRKQIERVP